MILSVKKSSSHTVAAAVAVTCATLAVLACGGCGHVRKAQAPPAMVRVAAPSANDYKALSDALAKVANGGTVELGAGLYDLGNQSLIITHTSVHLVGAGKDKTEIQSSAAQRLLEFDGPGQFTASGIGFRHIGSLPGSAVILRDAQIRIQSCWLRGARAKPGWYFASLYLKGHTTGIVLDCVMSNGSAGIDIGGTSNVSVQDNVCSDCDYSGICFFDKAAGEASGNTCQRNADGIVVQDRADPHVDDNDCNNNTDDGMDLHGQTTALVEGNRCNNNHYCGIWIDGSAMPRVTNCICTHNADGIEVAGSAEPKISGNTCNSDHSVGIGCSAHAGGSVVSNQCNRNGTKLEGGICIGGHANVYVGDNSCEYNRNYGILFRDSARGVVTGNYCSDSNYGIDVDPHSHPTLKHNNCEYNRTQNIYNWR